MIRFNVSIIVDGVPYKAGDAVPEAEIPGGCLDSMLRLKQVERVPDPPKTDAKKPAAPAVGQPQASKPGN